MHIVSIDSLTRALALVGLVAARGRVPTRETEAGAGTEGV